MQNFSIETSTNGTSDGFTSNEPVTESRKDCILVADDSELVRGILCALLSKEYDVLEASNGREVISLLQSESTNISCILLDIIMPVLDGKAVLRYMRENGLIDRIPTLALTGLSNADEKISCYEAGVTDLIEKPYDPKLLMLKVRRTIRAFHTARNGSESSPASLEQLSLYQNVLAALPFAVCVFDATTHIIKYRNELFSQMATAATGLVGRPLEVVLQPDHAGKIAKATEDLIQFHHQHPIEIIHSGNRLSVSLNALRNETGAISDIILSAVHLSASPHSFSNESSVGASRTSSPASSTLPRLSTSTPVDASASHTSKTPAIRRVLS